MDAVQAAAVRVKPKQEPIEVKAPAPAEPDQPAAPEAQAPIEAKAPVAPMVPEEPAPKALPKPAPIIEASREPIAEPAQPKAIATAPLTVGTPPAAKTIEVTPPAAKTIEARVSVAPPKVRSASPAASQRNNAVGLGLVTTATSPDPLPLSGDNVSSMIVMTSPAAGKEATEAEVSEAEAERPIRRHRGGGGRAGSRSEAEGQAQDAVRRSRGAS